eukprot:3569898-Rhodomonas_salina.5
MANVSTAHRVGSCASYAGTGHGVAQYRASRRESVGRYGSIPGVWVALRRSSIRSVSYTHLRAHETEADL